jgi:hypothetical protein
MKPAEIQSFDDLIKYLRNFTTWDGDHVHDFGGAFMMLGAILDNIREDEAYFDDIGRYLTDDQKTFLKRAAEQASCPVDDD